MVSTDNDWRVRVKAGDKLELAGDPTRRSGPPPESMGINIVYWVRDSPTPPANAPTRTYQRRPEGCAESWPPEGENEDPTVARPAKNGSKLELDPDPTKLPDGSGNRRPFTISGFSYNQGVLRLPGSAGRPPVVPPAGSIRSPSLSDSDITNEVWHSITSCAAPCNKSTGICIRSRTAKSSSSQPDGTGQSSGRSATPNGRRPAIWKKGTYTFFCRIHPADARRLPGQVTGVARPAEPRSRSFRGRLVRVLAEDLDEQDPGVHHRRQDRSGACRRKPSTSRCHCP